MLVFAWWFACLCDSYASTYHRRMPIIKDDDYDVDFYTAEPLAEDANRANQGPREHLEVRYTINRATFQSNKCSLIDIGARTLTAKRVRL